MSDSDETICDDGEDRITSSPSQMSPSIIAPLPSWKDSLANKTSTESETTLDSAGGSPEFLPPSAKIQRLAEETTGLTGEPAIPRVNQELQELQRSQIEATFKTEKPAAEKLKLIKEKEEKIDELLELLETNMKRGVALRESPTFAQVKLLMTQVKTQLAEFAHYQQQQRQQIAKSNNESQDTQDGSESQWTAETKKKIFMLATQQKDLLKLLQCHKKLLEKVQTIKQKARSGTEHILPTVEAHRISHGRVNSQQNVTDKHTGQPSSATLSASNLNLSGFTMPAISTLTSESKSGAQSVKTPISSSLKHVPSTVTCLPDNCKSPSGGTEQVHPASVSHTDTLTSHSMSIPGTLSAMTQPRVKNVAASQVIPSGAKTQLHSASTSHTETLALHSTGILTSETLSGMPQPRVQNVVLRTGQLYQVGDRQVYVLPQGLTTSLPSSFAATQVSQPQPVTTAKIPSYTASLATKGTLAVTPTSGLKPNLPEVQPTQGTSCRVSSLLSTEKSYQGRIMHSSSQPSSCPSQAPSTNVTLPVPTTASLSNSSTLPVLNNTLLSTSSALQKNTASSTASGPSNQRSKDATPVNQSAAISLATNENSTAPLLQNSARVQSQYTMPSQNMVGVQSSVDKTTLSVTTKAPAVQSKSSQSLLRRNSFGSDLPDMKSLLSCNVIEAGSNVLSIQFEGRNFEASLRTSGLIESAGGETFRTPMAWMRAVTGSWNTVKQSQAYKMVHYKGKPLALFTIPSTEKEPCESRAKQNGARTANTLQDGQDKTHKESGLITSWEDIAQLLTNCQVMPIGRDEFIPTDSFLPVNFWDTANDVDIPPSVLADLDF